MGDWWLVVIVVLLVVTALVGVRFGILIERNRADKDRER